MRKDKGFTLIEILVVIAIIGILVAIILPVLARVKDQAKVTRTSSLITTLTIACDLYYNDWGGVYPPAFDSSGSAQKNGGIELLYRALTTREGRSTRDYATDVSIEDIGDVDGDGQREFIDAWGNPLVYFDSPNYSKSCEYQAANGVTFTAQPQRNPEDNRWYRPGKFMMWSVGKYGINKNGLEDNINNF
ncbi:MAG: hypothetical protein Kow00107_11080 [Planctomycetota bacterium]